MDESIAIKVENISKVFPLRQSQIDDDGQVVHEHWALKNVSFEIKKGESVGIIGPNGSGKSTLLKILAGVTKPSSGSVQIRGRVASILDIGAGFHPELTGKENVFLNGQIHGFSKKEIAEKFDEIVEFSGIEKFIDEPVKNYSNGMYLRLAFSIMAHLDFDVYLFDEVMSVGDAQFSSKSRQKIRDLTDLRKTIVYVSHNVSELESQNRFIKLGNQRDETRSYALADYLENVVTQNGNQIHTQNVELIDFSSHANSDELYVSRLALKQSEADIFYSDKPFTIELDYQIKSNFKHICPIIKLMDIQGNQILSSSPLFQENTGSEDGHHQFNCTIPPYLFGFSTYKINLFFMQQSVDNETKIIVKMYDLIYFKTHFVNRYSKSINFEIINQSAGLFPQFEWQLK